MKLQQWIRMPARLLWIAQLRPFLSSLVCYARHPCRFLGTPGGIPRCLRAVIRDVKGRHHIRASGGFFRNSAISFVGCICWRLGRRFRLAQWPAGFVLCDAKKRRNHEVEAELSQITKSSPPSQRFGRTAGWRSLFERTEWSSLISSRTCHDLRQVTSRSLSYPWLNLINSQFSSRMFFSPLTILDLKNSVDMISRSLQKNSISAEGKFVNNSLKMKIVAFLSVLLSVGSVLCEDDFTSTPVVLWHGMGTWSCLIRGLSTEMQISLLTSLITLLSMISKLGDSCCFPFSMGMIKKLIEKNLNNTVYVKSLEIGGSLVRDYESSYFIHPKKQVWMSRLLCWSMHDDKKSSFPNRIGWRCMRTNQLWPTSGQQNIQRHRILSRISVSVIKLSQH